METNQDTLSPTTLAGGIDTAMHELCGKSEQELAEAFARARRVAAEQIVIAAAIVRIYDDIGWDTTKLSASARDLQYLRRIAYGQMLPELLMSDRVSDGLVRYVARLPIVDQRRVASNEPLEVAALNGDGAGYRRIRPSELTPEQVRQVFAVDHVRSLAEQRSYLEECAARHPATPAGPGPVIIDEKSRCIYVTGDKIRLSVKQLVEYAARLAG